MSEKWTGHTHGQSGTERHRGEQRTDHGGEKELDVVRLVGKETQGDQIQHQQGMEEKW